MSHVPNLVVALLLVVIGFIGIIKALKDKRASKSLPCPAKELKARDNQYLFMSTVALLSGVALAVIRLREEGMSH
jgi:hypothetical protein